ncbi:DUF397 domain-containing protein [Streptomyces rimosus]|uniref:DUF397 domain-containing protein n=1 Tax=Streptomyces rimosus TaxID=1927 RepID=UPI00069F1362|nr:DUF397 domain-containing protein [Streptomyces rimosus]
MSTAVVWRKSSYSGSDADTCVEVAVRPGAVSVRDSKDATGPQLDFSARAWAIFIPFLVAEA